MMQLLADFNAIDEFGRIWLPAAERADVHRGQIVMLTDGEIEVAAVLDYDKSRRVWVGKPDPSSVNDLAHERPTVPAS